MSSYINADDFGRTPSINEAITFGFNQHILNRTTIMVNMPYVDDAVFLSKKNNFFDKVGLHINLDEGVPLTNEIRQCTLFCDETGQFNGKFRKGKISKLILFDSKTRSGCRKEVEAQILKFKKLGFPLRHADSHHHVHTLPSLLPIITTVAKKNGLESMRIRFNLQSSSFIKIPLIYLINSYLKYNFETTKFFCDSLFYFQNKPKLDSMEVMCHPDVIDGKYYDVIGKRGSASYIDLINLKIV